jgi:hypothetical protein
VQYVCIGRNNERDTREIEKKRLKSKGEIESKMFPPSLLCIYLKKPNFSKEISRQLSIQFDGCDDDEEETTSRLR